MNPSDNPSQPDPQAVPPVNPPVFHNPLAQGHDDRTEQLPAMQPAAAPSPPVIHPKPLETPPTAITTTDVVAPTSISAVPAQPTISQLPKATVQPAPVRLAPEPKADDYHAAVATQTAHTAPFGSPVAHTGASALPTPVPAKPSRKGLLFGGVAGVILVGLAIGGYFWLKNPSRKTTPSASVPATAASKRDTQEKPVQPFAQKVATDCYVMQVTIPVDTQRNKDCLLDLRYGEQKISSITVSPQREFDVVANDNSGQASDGTTRFDTEKYLDGLIANAISKELIVTREKLTVGGLEATKVVGKQQASSASVVAYVFIVLPEGDRKFNEKTFVAFIVTGAYNDDYSRKGFDQALATWSWK